MNEQNTKKENDSRGKSYLKRQKPKNSLKSIKEKLEKYLKQAEKTGTPSKKRITDDDLKNTEKFINSLIARGKIYSKKNPLVSRKPNLTNRAKGGIVKKNKGGLMVKPKAAKRGY
jgi:hypothetical protein